MANIELRVTPKRRIIKAASSTIIPSNKDVNQALIPRTFV